MTVLLGPTPCRACRQPVTVVRRPVMIHDTHGSNQYQERPSRVPSTELREVVVISGEHKHRCA